jgi:hypothetical protein
VKLEEFVHTVESRVYALGKRFWPSDPRSEWRDDIERLSTQLNQHAHRAMHYRDALDQTRARIADNEVREAVLASHVETYIHIGDQATAYRQALELDQVRHQLGEDRARLPIDEKAYRFHRARLDELERRLAEVEAKLQARASV